VGSQQFTIGIPLHLAFEFWVSKPTVWLVNTNTGSLPTHVNGGFGLVRTFRMCMLWIYAHFGEALICLIHCIYGCFNIDQNVQILEELLHAFFYWKL